MTVVDSAAPPPRLHVVEWVIAFLAIIATRIATIPRTVWEFDETLFMRALETYNPVLHTPPPPGYPLFVATGKFVRFFIHDSFWTLITISVIGSIAGFIMLFLVGTKLSGNARAGLAASLLFYLSPTMLVHSTLPISDPAGLALLAWAVLMCLRLLDEDADDARAAITAVACAVTVGWRLQFSIAIVPLIGITFLLVRGWRKKLILFVVFTIVCIAWLIPLIASSNGWEGFMRLQGKQVGYFAAHDADVSRSGWSTPRVLFRFIAHPWGPKQLSFPLLALALVGVLAAVKRISWRLLAPVAAMWITYLGFCLALMDPADGSRYALPSVLCFAIFGGIGLEAIVRWAAERIDRRQAEWLGHGAIALFGAGAIIYVSTLITVRTSEASPGTAAAHFALDRYKPGTVALYELPFYPHALYFFKAYSPMALDKGLAKYGDRADVPLFVYAHGMSRAPGATVFRWPASDAYSKLTRDQYRVASIIPLPPNRRFKPLKGVEQQEREPEGKEWRWLLREAEFALPPVGARTLRIALGLPLASPIESNDVTIYVDGREAKRIRVIRDKVTVVEVPVSHAGSRILLVSAQSYVPAEVPGTLNRDRRRLAVEMYALEQIR